MMTHCYYRPVHWWRPKPQSPEINSSETKSQYISSSSELLPSFVDLQNKTHMTLYHRQRPPYPCSSNTSSTTGDSSRRNANTSTPAGVIQPDKSPKGSVDAHIQHVVDLINQHSHYCTLSSCSGRLSIFDPSGSPPPFGTGGEEESTTLLANTDISGENSAAAGGSGGIGGGKGVGRWMLVSHDLVDPQEVVDLFSSSSSSSNTNADAEVSCSVSSLKQPWIFKFEPMLLHIAAASLRHGQLLLRLALDLGYRESGLVVTDKRVTVAIRCHSLALVVPIFFDTSDGRVLLSDAYLNSFVDECNQKLQLNWDQMDRLYESLATHLFDLKKDCIRIYPQRNEQTTKSSSPPTTTTTIPPINLWNTSAIVMARNIGVENEKSDSGECIWVLGGYGKGPDTAIVSNENNIETTVPSSSSSSSCRRSKELYRLTRKINHLDEHSSRSCHYGPWDTNWRICRIEGGSTKDDEGGMLTLSTGGSLKVNQWMTTCPDLQGMTSCQLQPAGLMLFWGGRQSPVRPSPASTVYVLDTQNQQPRLANVVIESQHERKSSVPVARWGHSLIAISNDRAVLIGGCKDDDGALDDVWILHLLHGRNSECSGTSFFQWERVDTTLPSPRFHFGSTLLDNDTIMILGGLKDTKAILDPFEENSNDTDHDDDVLAIRVGRTQVADSQETTETMQHNPLTNVHSMDVRLKNRGGAGQNPSPRFGVGMSCCTLMSKHLVVVTGGISFTEEEDKNDNPIQTYWVTFRQDEIELDRIPNATVGTENETVGSLDFGSLVHHCCLSVGDDDHSNDSDDNENRSHEIVLIGGGVSSFAFGETFAKSHHLCLDISNISSGGNVTVNLQNGSRGGVSTGLQSSQKQQQQLADDDNHKPKANVIYVHPSDAKRVKNFLESSKLLDKRFRMMKIDHHPDPGGEGDSQTQQTRVALPVIDRASQVVDDEDLISDPSLSTSSSSSTTLNLKDCILGRGVEDLPWSSSQIASVKNRRR